MSEWDERDEKTGFFIFCVILFYFFLQGIVERLTDIWQEQCLLFAAVAHRCSRLDCNGTLMDLSDVRVT